MSTRREFKMIETKLPKIITKSSANTGHCNPKIIEARAINRDRSREISKDYTLFEVGWASAVELAMKTARFFQRLKKFCTEQSIPMIDDEMQMVGVVQVRMFCCENYGGRPIFFNSSFLVASQTFMQSLIYFSMVFFNRFIIIS